MTVAIEMGHTSAGAPANLDLEELLATRLLVQIGRASCRERV